MIVNQHRDQPASRFIGLYPRQAPAKPLSFPSLLLSTQVEGCGSTVSYGWRASQLPRKLTRLRQSILVPHTTNWSSDQSAGETGSPASRFFRARADDDDEERAGFSVPGLETMSKLFKPTQAQLQKLLINGESADDVFTRMRLNQAGDTLLHNEEFVRWLKYVDDLKIKHPTIKTSAISTLTAQYSDDGLYKLIEAGLKNGETEKVARRLKSELMKHWVTTGNDPDKVFHIMELDKVKKNILSNSEFTHWAQYVDDVTAKHPNIPTSMVPTLLNYYSDDVQFKMTEAAKRVEGTKTIATKLQEQVVQA